MQCKFFIIVILFLLIKLPSIQVVNAATGESSYRISQYCSEVAYRELNNFIGDYSSNSRYKRIDQYRILDGAFGYCMSRYGIPIKQYIDYSHTNLFWNEDIF